MQGCEGRAGSTLPLQDVKVRSAPGQMGSLQQEKRDGSSFLCGGGKTEKCSLVFVKPEFKKTKKCRSTDSQSTQGIFRILLFLQLSSTSMRLSFEVWGKMYCK